MPYDKYNRGQFKEKQILLSGQTFKIAIYIRWRWHRGDINGWRSITKLSLTLGNMTLRYDRET